MEQLLTIKYGTKLPELEVSWLTREDVMLLLRAGFGNRHTRAFDEPEKGKHHSAA